MRKILCGLAAISLAFNLGTAQAEKLVLTGSSTVASLALEIGKRFERLHPGVRVDVQTGGSSRGISDARAGLADIGMVSRALKPEEADLYGHAIALDGVALIVHNSNAISALSDDRVRAIYTGKVTQWSEVGGVARKIVVVNKAEGRSTLELFLHYFKLNNPEIRAQVVIGDNQQGIKTVAANPDAIGYVSIGTAEYEAAHGTPIRLLPLHGVAASVANVRNGQFPLSRPLNLVTKTPPVGLVKTFIEFAQSATVHDLIDAQYFIPLAR
ncbi:phosphate ABC transporter substrate-binding protein [Ferrigenium sp. UT5]|uniref:phosphate ABC transporter substrate-binding protein n=1 Tax=Ferrigenium sp. UT5 TaxID=3242105 RepID=UPI003552FA5F